MSYRFDAEGLGCGQLVFELHKRISKLQPGERIEVNAPNPGANVDLAAWCNMTGHILLSSDHPVYLIEHRKE